MPHFTKINIYIILASLTLPSSVAVSQEIQDDSNSKPVYWYKANAGLNSLLRVPPSEWFDFDASVSSWIPFGEPYNCDAFSPSINLVDYGEVFEQTSTCKVTEQQVTQITQKNQSGETRTLPDRITTRVADASITREAIGVFDYVVSTAKGEFGSWELSSSAYNCTYWEPPSDEYPMGMEITQTRDCQIDSVRQRPVLEVYLSGKEVSSEVETEVKTTAQQYVGVSYGTLSDWQESSSLTTAWVDTGVVDDSGWSPSVNAQEGNFPQTRTIKVSQKRTVQAMEIDAYTGKHRPVGEPTLETREFDKSEARTVSLRFSGWLTESELNHSDWAPEIAGQTKGFVQTSNYDESQSRTVRYFADGVEIGSRAESQTIPAVKSRNVHFEAGVFEKDGELYDCGEFSESVLQDGVYIKSIDCSQNYARELTYRISGEDNVVIQDSKTETISDQRTNDDASLWEDYDPLISKWVNESSEISKDWSPGIEGQKTNFNQEKETVYHQTADVTERERNTVNGAIRNKGEPYKIKRTVSRVIGREIITGEPRITQESGTPTEWMPLLEGQIGTIELTRERKTSTLFTYTYRYKEGDSTLILGQHTERSDTKNVTDTMEVYSVVHGWSVSRNDIVQDHSPTYEEMEEKGIEGVVKREIILNRELTRTIEYKRYQIYGSDTRHALYSEVKDVGNLFFYSEVKGEFTPWRHIGINSTTTTPSSFEGIHSNFTRVTEQERSFSRDYRVVQKSNGSYYSPKVVYFGAPQTKVEDVTFAEVIRVDVGKWSDGTKDGVRTISSTGYIPDIVDQTEPFTQTFEAERWQTRVIRYLNSSGRYEYSREQEYKPATFRYTVIVTPKAQPWAASDEPYDCAYDSESSQRCKQDEISLVQYQKNASSTLDGYTYTQRRTVEVIVETDDTQGEWLQYTPLEGEWSVHESRANSGWLPAFKDNTVNFTQRDSFETIYKRNVTARERNTVTGQIRNLPTAIEYSNPVQRESVRQVSVKRLPDDRQLLSSGSWLPEVDAQFSPFTQTRTLTYQGSPKYEYTIGSYTSSIVVFEPTGEEEVLESRYIYPVINEWTDSQSSVYSDWAPLVTNQTSAFTQVRQATTPQTRRTEYRVNNKSGANVGQHLDSRTNIFNESRLLYPYIDPWMNAVDTEYSEWLPKIIDQREVFSQTRVTDVEQTQVVRFYTVNKSEINTTSLGSFGGSYTHSRTVTLTENRSIKPEVVFSDFSITELGSWSPATSDVTKKENYVVSRQVLGLTRLNIGYYYLIIGEVGGQSKGLVGHKNFQENMDVVERLTVQVTVDPWVRNGSQSCDEWSPLANTVTSGETFEQSRMCIYGFTRDNIQRLPASAYQYNASSTKTFREYKNEPASERRGAVGTM